MYSLFRRACRKISAHEPAAVLAHACSCAHYGRPAAEDGASIVVAHQVCLDYAVVQRVKIVDSRSPFALCRDNGASPANDQRLMTNDKFFGGSGA